MSDCTETKHMEIIQEFSADIFKNMQKWFEESL